MTSIEQVIHMTPLEWSRVPDNPLQRDTARRARTARHLIEADPVYEQVQATVAMARLPDGRTYKLDGHTRCYVWMTGMKEPPRVLTAHVYPCSDLDQVRALYEAFDSRHALETTPDKVFGTLRDREIEFHSPLLKLHRFVSALRLASTILYGNAAQGASVRERIDAWEPELLLLDSCNPGRRRFPTAIIAGALLTFRRYGDQAMPFWTDYEADAGVKIDRKMDAVQALSERVLEAQITRSRNLGRDSGRQLVTIVINAHEGWRRNRLYSPGGLRSMQSEPLSKWLAATRTTERTW